MAGIKGKVREIFEGEESAVSRNAKAKLCT